MSIIVTIGGGRASAWCADWALNNYPKEDVILYFNDTKWEHPDLYRFLNDLEQYFNHSITIDSDGRTPEELFYDHRALASNRMPFCSRVLKAERLQKFYKDKDTLIFGIGSDEEHRAKRLVSVYQIIASKTGKWPKLLFPLISEKATKAHVNNFLVEAGIELPVLYKLGFVHNNCSGGCVRAGKKSWRLLLMKLPEVYAERERVEEKMRDYLGKDVHYLKDETLKHLRERIQQQGQGLFEDEEEEEDFECMGVCNTQA